MLPRATLVEGPVGKARRAVGALAWWRSRDIVRFAIGHCAVAGVLQLGALLVDLARAGRPMPSIATLYWAWAGLALIAAVPALITIMLATPRGRFATAALVGVAFYVLPAVVLAGALAPIATLLPVAVLWHLVLARAPVAESTPARAR